MNTEASSNYTKRSAADGSSKTVGQYLSIADLKRVFGRHHDCLITQHCKGQARKL
jgi:hypothetical protein